MRISDLFIAGDESGPVFRHRERGVGHGHGAGLSLPPVHQLIFFEWPELRLFCW